MVRLLRSLWAIGPAVATACAGGLDEGHNASLAVDLLHSAAASEPASAYPPDVTQFFSVRTADAPSLSPDGARVAYRTQTSGSPQVWIADAEGGVPRQITFGEPVTFHHWSPAGNWIIYGVDRGGNEREGYYLISPDGTRERELLPPSDAFRAFGGFTTDGSTIAYATTGRNGSDFDVHLLDIETGEAREVLRGPMGLYARSFGPDGGSLLITEARGEDANDVYLYDIAAARRDTLLRPVERAQFAGFQWAPDGRGFYVYTDQGQDHAGVAFYSLDTRRLDYIATPPHCVDGLALSGNGRYLAWTTNEDGYSALHVHDLSTRTAVPIPDLPRGVYSIVWAAAAPVLAVRVASPQVPGDIWVWNAVTGALDRATRSETAELDPARMVLPEHHSFSARDGVLIHANLYIPAGLESDERYPVLINVHGGPTLQARPTFKPILQYLLTRGIAVLDLNYRGSTGYGRTFARLNDHRLRPDELNDLADAAAWLDEDERLDATRIALMGGSYGGYLTMAGLSRMPERWRAGVAIVGVSNWITALEDTSPALRASDRVEYGDIDDADDRKFFRELSPLTYVDDLRAPILLIHGANDPRVPAAESDQFAQRLRNRGVGVEYLRFADEGHQIRRTPNRITTARRIAAFLEEQLALR